MNVILVGLRGSGKTTVGRRLAGLLHRPFLDLDEELEREEGLSIAELVGQLGWGGFRERESALLRRTCAGDGQVLAVGGGAILNPDNVRLMRERGFVLWLDADPDTLVERLQNDPATTHRRPAFTTGPLITEIHALAVDREPLYRRAAHQRIDTASQSADQAALAIRELVEDLANGRQ